MQTGQTVTGNIGATDIEGDPLKYTVTQGPPKYGTVTIDQATGNFTYTPDDINYNAAQTDSFTISVTDGKFNVLMPFSSRTVSASSSLTVLSPQATRVILNVPSTITSPQIPRFSPDGKSLYFAGTPVAGGAQRALHDERRRHRRVDRHLRHLRSVDKYHQRSAQTGSDC